MLMELRLLKENEMIAKRGSQYVVMDSKGKKVLGRHATKAEAVNQLQAIEASKARRKK